MLDWKQRLYAFLLRKIVGPFLDESGASKLRDSIDFSLQDGLLVLKDVALNNVTLSEKLSSTGFCVTKANVQRLEIKLSLRENAGTSQSSLVWRAMKLGGSTEKESLPAVSLVAEIYVRGVDLEIQPLCATPSAEPRVTAEENESGVVTRSRIRSYVDAAIASLQLTLQLSNINLKLRHGSCWVSFCLSSMTFKDTLSAQAGDEEEKTTPSVSKCLDFSDITVHVGGGKKDAVVALAKGNGRVFLSANDYASTTNGCVKVHHDVEASLNHQLNVSFDVSTLGYLHIVATGFNNARENVSRAEPDSEVVAPEPSPRLAKPGISDEEEDLLAISGIMKQYREAYHLTEINQFRGGLLIPSQAYMDDLEALEEDDEMTFDLFWDAHQQSEHDVSVTLKEHDHPGNSNALDPTGGSQSKICVRLLSISVKIGFRELWSQAGPQEYVLATLDGLNISLLTTSCQSRLEINVGDFTIEDAQVVAFDRNVSSAKLDIGTIFSFDTAAEEMEDCAYHRIDSPKPCFRLNVVSDHAGSRSIECTLQTVELNVRQRSLCNLLLFARSISKSSGNSETSVAQILGSTNTNRVFFTCHCPSVTLLVPLLGCAMTAPVYDRIGETSLDSRVQESCLGLLIDTLELKWTRNDITREGSGVESEAQLTAWRLLFFSSAPIGDKASFGTHMQRTDLMLLNGRTEVEPCIPISLEFKKVTPPTKQGHDSFPIVPTISSFKARQKDEDSELDQLIDSILGSNEQSTKMSRSGAHPEVVMLAATEKSDAFISLRIPEIVSDLTKTEFVKTKEMLELVTFFGSEHNDDSREGLSSKLTVALVLRIDQISLALGEDFGMGDVHRPHSEKGRYSCLFTVDTLRAHLVICGSVMRQMRLLFQDTALYSANHPRNDPKVSRTEKDIRTRVTLMKQRIMAYKEAQVSPILFRSKLFTPICSDAPSFLLDVMDTSVKAESHGNPNFVQKQINLTCYHLTFRYDPDSNWLGRLKDLLPEPPQSVPTQPEKTPSMTRVFLTLADCSIDYISPEYFCKASRSVLRLGDLRCSSNIVVPTSQSRAISLSFGDLCCHMANERLSRAAEDAKLCRASMLLPMVQRRNERKSRAHGITAEALLREEGFVEVLTLDSAEAVVVSTKYRQANDSDIAVDASFGLLSVSVCKDSFRCFSDSIGELQAKLTALSDSDLSRMKKDMESSEWPDNTGASNASTPLYKPNAEDGDVVGYNEFPLDGYEWTEVDHDPLREIVIPDEDEQAASWYSVDDTSKTDEVVVPATSQSKKFPTRIIHHHFPFHPLSIPSANSFIVAGKHGVAPPSIQLKSRLVVHKVAVKLRFHDGYDWPSKVSDYENMFLRKHNAFVIVPPPRNEVLKIKIVEDNLPGGTRDASAVKRVELLTNLLDGDVKADGGQSPFENAPLPEDRARTFERQSELRRLSKKNKVYIQVSANGVALKLETFVKSESRRIFSVLGVSISDMFIAEAASTSTPVKMLGEWVNENEHPRDTRCGMLMLKMITWKPVYPLSTDGKIQNEECEVTMQLLPMRAIIDQRAIQFAQGFFRRDDEENSNDWTKALHLTPPPRFRTFRVQKWKLKVDYIPQKIDVDALRDGCIVELINLSPIDGMVITLGQVCVVDSVGFDDVVSDLTESWLEEIVSTQLYKFLANARPFEPISDVGQGITDLVVLPYEAFKNGDDVRRAVSAGMQSLAGTMAFQALTTTSRLTEYAASTMAALVGGRFQNTSSLPTRPTAAPKGVQDVTGHAMESLARGFQAANYKIVIVPYREYSRHGAVGAASSVLRGIPVMLVAPVTGAAEALSYTLLGARNALRPDIRREEEASRTGFTSYDT